MHVVIAFFVAWAVSGDLRIALGISLVEPFIQIIGFSVHEHLWERFRPGSKPSTPHVCCADSDLVEKAVEIFRQKKV